MPIRSGLVARVDATGAAFAGSQLQTQLYVNRRPELLQARISEALPELVDAQLHWVSPLAVDGYREYQDRAFLEQLGLGEHAEALPEFWPRGGPVWDGLALVALTDGRHGVLLAEGKSYPAELYGSGTQAKAHSASRELIERSLRQTQERLGIASSSASWTGRLYQTANRLAHLLWLRERGIPAWFVHLLFTGDPHGPTSADAWTAAVRDADEALGLPEHVDGFGHVLLPAGTREELVGEALWSISFTVAGHPPPKDGGFSILNPAHPHHPRAVALLTAAGEEARGAAFAAFAEHPLRIRVAMRTRAPAPGDGLNYLGGVADVLEDKSARAAADRTWPEKAAALGGLASFALYRNDRQFRDAGIDQDDHASEDSYTVTSWALPQ
jgi:hypothetical protein